MWKYGRIGKIAVKIFNGKTAVKIFNGKTAVKIFNFVENFRETGVKIRFCKKNQEKSEDFSLSGDRREYR